MNSNTLHPAYLLKTKQALYAYFRVNNIGPDQMINVISLQSLMVTYRGGYLEQALHELVAAQEVEVLRHGRFLRLLGKGYDAAQAAVTSQR